MRTHFEGRAITYEKYRPKFPKLFFKMLTDKLRLETNRRLGKYIDAGCGTGQLTIPLSQYFNRTIGLDPALDMLVEAEKVAKKRGCESIEWMQGYAEDISITEHKNINLVTIANAFHWMDHSIVVPKILQILDAQGYFVLIRSYGGITSDDSDWQTALNNILEFWVGEQRKTIVGDKYEQINWIETLNTYPFSSISSYEVPEERIWTVEELLGFYFTVSFCSEEKIGEHIEKYKDEVKETLLNLYPNNQFVQKHNITTIIAKK